MRVLTTIVQFAATASLVVSGLVAVHALTFGAAGKYRYTPERRTARIS